MHNYKRAILYIIREKKRTVILFGMIFVIEFLILMGMLINKSSENASDKLRKQIRGYFKIQVDVNTTDGKQEVDDNLIEKISNIEGIEKVNAMNVSYMAVPSLSLVPGRYTNEQDSKSQVTRIIGNTDSQLYDYFQLKILQLTKGKAITQKDKSAIIISQKLAEINHIKLGDRINLEVTKDVSDDSGLWGNTFEVNVVGFFKEKNPTQSNDLVVESDIPNNFLFVDESTCVAIMQLLEEQSVLSYNSGAIFFVKDPELMNQIIHQVKEVQGVEWKDLKVEVNNTSYEQKAKPLESLQNTTKMMVILSIVIGMVMISLLLLMWERERIHEAGILMSFGITKINIFLQHYMEVFVLYIFATILSVLVVVLFGRSIGRMCCGNTFSTYSFTLQIETVIIVGFLCIGIISISVIVGFVCIWKKKPKDILSLIE